MLKNVKVFSSKVRIFFLNHPIFNKVNIKKETNQLYN